MIPSTKERVLLHTAGHVNAAIRWKTGANVTRATAGGADAIDRRLAELDREWDVERALEAHAGAAALAGIALGILGSRKWFAVPALVGGFLLQHAVQGWCPPLPLLRRLGFRTAGEIDEERYALKVLRGDFYHLPALTTTDHWEAITRFEGEGGAVQGPEVPDVPDQATVNEALRAVRG
jgi:hypothetical protein